MIKLEVGQQVFFLFNDGVLTSKPGMNMCCDASDAIINKKFSKGPKK